MPFDVSGAEEQLGAAVVRMTFPLEASPKPACPGVRLDLVMAAVLSPVFPPFCAAAIHAAIIAFRLRKNCEPFHKVPWRHNI